MYEFSKVPRWLVNIFLFFDDLQSSYRAYEAPQGDRRVNTTFAGKGRASGPFIILSGPSKTAFAGKIRTSGPFLWTFHCLEWTL